MAKLRVARLSNAWTNASTREALSILSPSRDQIAALQMLMIAELTERPAEKTGGSSTQTMMGQMEATATPVARFLAKSALMEYARRPRKGTVSIPTRTLIQRRGVATPGAELNQESSLKIWTASTTTWKTSDIPTY